MEEALEPGICPRASNPVVGAGGPAGDGAQLPLDTVCGLEDAF